MSSCTSLMPTACPAKTWLKLIFFLPRQMRPQRVRTLVVEDLEELVEAGLLLQKISTGWLGGFFLQGEMHAFVPAVLLRMPRLDAFNANAQAEPPDREFAEVKQGVGGGKGHTVIAADVGRQAALLKKPFKHSESIVFFSGRERLASQQISAGMIGDRQRVAVLMISQ